MKRGSSVEAGRTKVLNIILIVKVIPGDTSTPHRGPRVNRPAFWRVGNEAGILGGSWPNQSP